MSRDQHLQNLADNVAALTAGYRTTEKATRHPGPGADGIHRRTPENITWAASHRGLIAQLHLAQIPGSRTDDTNTRTSKPGSRPPVAAAARDALDALEHGWAQHSDEWQIGIRNMRARMVVAAKGHRRGGATLGAALLDIRALAHALPDPWAEEAAHASGAWVRRARAALGWEAHTATLKGVGCPECGALLKVPQDASGDVWCPNRGCRDSEGRQMRWAREEWPFLLERLAGGGDAA